MRHATRLALVLVLLGMTALVPVENARSESIESSCTVTRNCENGPPYSISCTSASGTCSSGPENHGWVECDGSRQYCPPPCSFPNCYFLNGEFCPTGTTTLCSYWSPSGCLNYKCFCSNGQWNCP